MFQSDLISVSDDFIIQCWTVIFLFLKSLVAITFSQTNRYEIELTLNLMICFYFSKNSQYWSIFSSMLLFLYWKYLQMKKHFAFVTSLQKKKDWKCKTICWLLLNGDDYFFLNFHIWQLFMQSFNFHSEYNPIYIPSVIWSSYIYVAFLNRNTQ